MRPSLKTGLHLIGSVLGLVGVVFVVIRLGTYSEQIDLSRFNPTAWSITVLLAVLYGVNNFSLLQAWWHLLAFLGIPVEKGWALKAFGLSQLAKYVPGNVFHLAGRQALGMAAGLPGLQLAKSVMWELGQQACTGAFCGFLPYLLTWTGLPATVQFTLFCTAALIVATALRRFLSPAVGKAFLWQCCYMIVSSLVFVGTLAVLAPNSISSSSLLSFCAAYIVAWLAGFVTPGAPAGVGVRELVLLFLLQGMINESDLLLAVVLGRLVTVLGDFLFFLLAYFSPKVPHQTS